MATKPPNTTRRRTLKSIGAVGFLGSTGLVGTAAAATTGDGVVDPGESIQDEVDAANSGDTITIKSGVSADEQVTVSKNLTLNAESGASLTWSSNPGGNYSANSWLIVDSGASVTLTGLTFAGPFAGSNTAGIFVTDGALLDASGLTMQQMYTPSNGGVSGSQSHGGIAVGDHRFGTSPSNGTLELHDSEIDEFGKFAVSSVGDDSSVDIENSAINGSGTLGPGVGESGPAQDSVLVDGGDLVIADSQVSDVSYVDGFVAGTAVSVFGPSDKIVVKNNEFTDVAKSVSFQGNRSFDPTGGPIADALVKNNDINVWRGGPVPNSTTTASFGVEIFVGDGSPRDVVLRDSEITGNTIYNGRGVGIEGSTENVDFSDNTFRNNTQHVWQNGDIRNFGRWLSSWYSDNTFDKKFIKGRETIIYGENPHRN